MASFIGPRDSPWAQIAVAVAKAHLPLLLLGGLLAAVVARGTGLAAFYTGIGAVFLWFGLDIVVAGRTEKRPGARFARQLTVSYCFKAIAGFFLLAYSQPPTEILNGWLLAGAVSAVCVWLGVSMRTIMGMRILYFDDYDQTDSAGESERA